MEAADSLIFGSSPDLITPWTHCELLKFTFQIYVEGSASVQLSWSLTPLTERLSVSFSMIQAERGQSLNVNRQALLIMLLCLSKYRAHTNDILTVRI